MATLSEEQLSKVTSIVKSKLAVVQGWADAAKNAATTAIDSVGTLEVPNISVTFPAEPPLVDELEEPPMEAVPTGSVNNDPKSVTYDSKTSLGFTAPGVIPTPRYGASVYAPDRPSPSLAVPPTDYPTVADFEEPEKTSYETPTAPVIMAPNEPEFVAIDIPELTVPVIDAFIVEPPKQDKVKDRFTKYETDIDQALKLQRVDYDNFVVEFEVQQRQAIEVPYISGRNAREGIDGIAHYVKERAQQPKRLMDEAAIAIDREVAAEVKKATAEWAARNFSTVPGMLIDQVNELEIAGGRKLRAASTKINQETTAKAKEDFERELKILLSLEQNLIDCHLEKIRQYVETEKIEVKLQMELFNAAMELYKSKLNIINIQIEAFNTEQRAKLQLVDAYKTAVDGAIAETAENDARLQVYSSQVQTLKAQVDVYSTSVKAATAPIEEYKAQLIGVKAKADTVVANIESYREAVRGYAAAVEASSAEIQAFIAQAQAASSVTGVAETNARAYATHIQEAARANSVYRTFASEQADVLNSYIQTYRDAASVNESYVRAQAAKVSAQADITAARVSAYERYVRNFSSYNRAAADKSAAATSHSMTAKENIARAEALANQARSEVDKITAGALAAKAQALAGLAQGAMSALHVSATAQGAGSTAASFSHGDSWTSNWGGTKSQSESRSVSVSG